MKKQSVEDEELSRLAKEYFKDDYTEPAPERLERLKEIMKQNKTNNKISKKNMWIKITSIAASMCCLILCIVLPITLKQEPLYTYTDLIKNEIPVEEAESYIDTYYSKYSFLFDDCNITVSYGQYAGDKLCILGLKGSKKDIPFTYVEITLIIDQKIEFPEKTEYITDAEIVTENDYTLYKKNIQDFQNQKISALFDYKNYDLYLKFDINDEDLFNKFL